MGNIDFQIIYKMTMEYVKYETVTEFNFKVLHNIV